MGDWEVGLGKRGKDLEWKLPLKFKGHLTLAVEQHS